MTEATKSRVVDAPQITEIYANRFVSSSYDGGAIVLTLGTQRLVPDRMETQPKQGELPTVHVTARLALSPAAAVELINGLNTVLKAIANKSPGIVSVVPPVEGSKGQTAPG